MARYTVKQVAELTGIRPATLRAWQRRYGVVEPERTPSGYRLYGDDDVARLARMAALVADGTPASLAAEQVGAHGAQPPGAPSSPDRTAVAAGDDQARGAGEPGSPASQELVRAAESFDPVLLDQVLDEAFARSSLERVVDGWLMPALAELGDAWAEGRVDAAGEHFVSGAVHRRLAQWFEAAGGGPGAPVAVVGLPPGSLHQLAAMAFATLLRRQGIDVRYLGADVPTSSWQRTVELLGPAVVVVGVPTPADVQAATEVVRTLDRPSSVHLGGRGAPAVAGTTGAPTLPDGLAESARALAGRFRAAGR